MQYNKITILFILIFPLSVKAQGEINIKPITINKDSYEFKHIEQIITEDISPTPIEEAPTTNLKKELPPPKTTEIKAVELPPMENTEAPPKTKNLNDFHTTPPSFESVYLVEKTNELAVFALPEPQQIEEISNIISTTTITPINTETDERKVVGIIENETINTKSITSNKELVYGENVHNGEIIEGDNTIIKMADNTILHLMPKSKIKIVKYNINPIDKESSIIHLMDGTMRVIAGYQPSIHSFRLAIVTKHNIFTMSKPSTDFWIQTQTEENKNSYIQVINNRVLISPRDIKNKSIGVKLSKKTYIINDLGKVSDMKTEKENPINKNSNSPIINYTQHNKESITLKQKYTHLFTH